MSTSQGTAHSSNTKALNNQKGLSLNSETGTSNQANDIDKAHVVVEARTSDLLCLDRLPASFVEPVKTSSTPNCQLDENLAIPSMLYGKFQNLVKGEEVKQADLLKLHGVQDKQRYDEEAHSMSVVSETPESSKS